MLWVENLEKTKEEKDWEPNKYRKNYSQAIITDGMGYE